MKKLLHKPLFVKLGLLGIFTVIFLLSVIIFAVPCGGKYTDYNMFRLSVSFKERPSSSIVCIIYLIFLMLYLVPIAIDGITIKKGKAVWNYVCSIYGLGINVAFIIFNILYSALTGGQIALAIVNIVLGILGVIITVLDQRVLKYDVDEKAKKPITTNNEKKVEKPLKNTNSKPLVNIILGISILEVVSLISLFIVPVFSAVINSVDTGMALGNVLFAQKVSDINQVFFIVIFLLVLASIIYSVYSVSFYFNDKTRFVERTKVLVYLNFAISLIFFLMGFFMTFYYKIKNVPAYTNAYGPMVFFIVEALAFSIVKGIFEVREGHVEAKKEEKHLKFEPLIYVIGVTFVTLSALFLNVIKININVYDYKQNLALTGIKVLTDYTTLGSGYQVLAFLLIVDFIVAGVGLLLSFTSYFAKYSGYARVAKFTIYANFFFTFLITVAVYFFSIAEQINIDTIKDTLEHYGITYTGTSVLKITTDMLYCLLLDVVVIVIMMVRKTFNNEELMDNRGGAYNPPMMNSPANAAPIAQAAPQQVAPQAMQQGPQQSYQPQQPSITPEMMNGAIQSQIADALGKQKEEEEANFDPCPAFTELDEKIPEFKKDLEQRKATEVGTYDLNGLINFIVEYARDSRLHLSYSQQDIATFVSGLGACRLSILQGMSGTGKTSLPKIFSEAILGNCEIIEVESSWKDKNELLGYYNEFSEKFTPKKFTQALYKAALNKEIPTFIVLDEMNLSRIEYYFSDFLSLMENEEGKREIKLINIKLSRKLDGTDYDYSQLEDGHTLKIPSNIWFIGTANRDESTFVISDKVYDRAYTMNFNKRAPKVRDFGKPIPQRFFTYKEIADMLEKAKKSGKFDAENNKTIKAVEELLAPFNISFGNRILKQMEDFVNVYQACFPGKDVLDEAIETILLSKVVAKLEVKIIENKEKLVHDFEDLKLMRCADFVNKLNEE